MKPLAFVPFLLSVLACSDAPPEDAALLAIGDSLLDFNRPDEDIATVMADALSITHASVSYTHLTLPTIGSV